MSQQDDSKRLTKVLFVKDYPPGDPRPSSFSLFLTYDTDAEPYWDFDRAAWQV